MCPRLALNLLYRLLWLLLSLQEVDIIGTPIQVLFVILANMYLQNNFFGGLKSLDGFFTSRKNLLLS